MSNDRLTLPPVDAKKTNLTCHFCIVGCGYHVYKWPENKEGGKAPNQNSLKLDFRKQLPAFSVVATKAQQTVVADKDGSRHNVLVIPDQACVVNEGGGSARPAHGQLYVQRGQPTQCAAGASELAYRRPVAGNRLEPGARLVCGRDQKSSRQQRAARTCLR